MTTTKLNLPRYIQLVENDKENIIITVIKDCTKEQALQQVEQDRNTKIEPWKHLIQFTKQTVSLINNSINTLFLQCFLVVVVNKPQTKETT